MANMLKMRYLTLILLFIINLKSYSQDIRMLDEINDSIFFYSEMLTISNPHDIKEKANTRIVWLINKALKQEKSIDYQFSGQKNISVLTSSDKKFRVISWVIPYSDYSSSYFGFVQTYNYKLKKYEVDELEDHGSDIKNPEKQTLSAANWYGARYFKLIENKSRGKYYYTLLGWRSQGLLVNSKIIEIVTLKQNGVPVFGFSSFNMGKLPDYKNVKPKRIVFSYSSNVAMHLAYERQTIHKIIKEETTKLVKNKNNTDFSAQKEQVRIPPKTKDINSEMIVFDRLSPKSPELKGFYQFYYPELNVVDAFLWEKGKWVLYQDIDARNPGQQVAPKDVKPAKPVTYELFEK